MSTAILTACLDRLLTLGLSPMPPIAWPGGSYNPPDQGMWLEVKLFPNEPVDPVWNSDGCYNAIGFFQVLVGFRPGAQAEASGRLIDASELADLVINHYSKGTFLGPVRVLKTPWQSPPVTESDKLFIPVTIPYRGLVS